MTRKKGISKIMMFQKILQKVLAHKTHQTIISCHKWIKLPLADRWKEVTPLSGK
jgi:hypothetical protein